MKASTVKVETVIGATKKKRQIKRRDRNRRHQKKSEIVIGEAVIGETEYLQRRALEKLSFQGRISIRSYFLLIFVGQLLCIDIIQI